jgi:hypothetical protein
MTRLTCCAERIRLPIDRPTKQRMHGLVSGLVVLFQLAGLVLWPECFHMAG